MEVMTRPANARPGAQHPNFDPVVNQEAEVRPIPGLNIPEPGVVWRWDMYKDGGWFTGKRMFRTIDEANAWRDADPTLREERGMIITAIVLSRD